MGGDVSSSSSSSFASSSRGREIIYIYIHTHIGVLRVDDELPLRHDRRFRFTFVSTTPCSNPWNNGLSRKNDIDRRGDRHK